MHIMRFITYFERNKRYLLCVHSLYASKQIMLPSQPQPSRRFEQHSARDTSRRPKTPQHHHVVRWPLGPPPSSPWEHQNKLRRLLGCVAPIWMCWVVNLDEPLHSFPQHCGSGWINSLINWIYMYQYISPAKPDILPYIFRRYVSTHMTAGWEDQRVQRRTSGAELMGTGQHESESVIEKITTTTNNLWIECHYNIHGNLKWPVRVLVHSWNWLCTLCVLRAGPGAHYKWRRLPYVETSTISEMCFPGHETKARLARFWRVADSPR